MIRVVQLCWLVVLVSLAGCGRNQPQVRGKVHFPDGTPLDQGKVVLSSLDGPHGASSDPLGKDGSFLLGSKKPDDGVPVGRYSVIIVGAAEPPADEAARMAPPKYLIDSRFMDPAKSGLTFEVKANGDNFLDITVEPPPKK